MVQIKFLKINISYEIFHLHSYKVKACKNYGKIIMKKLVKNKPPDQFI